MNSLTQDMTIDSAAAMPADWRDLFALTKPRVMSLVVFTALCGMLAAPVAVHPIIGFTGILAVALGAGASGALNQWYEADIDARMRRTQGRPLPAGRMSRDSALQFGVGLACFSVLLMLVAVGMLAAAILAVSILFYVLVYTVWLKPRTPQNIVIGGAAGAFPPVIGWAIATGDVTLMPLLMFLLIFLWTPPHFWALALFVKSDYAAAGIPMMPVVAGEAATRRQIFGYSLVMGACAVAPWALGLTGAVYGLVASGMSLAFIALAAQVAVPALRPSMDLLAEKRLFAFSIAYLFLLFAAMVADRLVG